MSYKEFNIDKRDFRFLISLCHKDLLRPISKVPLHYFLENWKLKGLDSYFEPMANKELFFSILCWNLLFLGRVWNLTISQYQVSCSTCYQIWECDSKLLEHEADWACKMLDNKCTNEEMRRNYGGGLGEEIGNSSCIFPPCRHFIVGNASIGNTYELWNDLNYQPVSLVMGEKKANIQYTLVNCQLDGEDISLQRWCGGEFTKSNWTHSSTWVPLQDRLTSTHLQPYHQVTIGSSNNSDSVQSIYYYFACGILPYVEGVEETEELVLPENTNQDNDDRYEEEEELEELAAVIDLKFSFWQASYSVGTSIQVPKILGQLACMVLSMFLVLTS